MKLVDIVKKIDEVNQELALFQEDKETLDSYIVIR